MISPQWLGLLMSRTNFHGPKDVRAIEVRLYFARDHSDAPQKYSDADVKKMLAYLIDNIFMEFGGRIFQQTIGTPIGTKCAPLLADLFLYSYKAEFYHQNTKSPPSRQETPRTAIQFHLQIYRWCIVSEKHKICRVFRIHLSTWTWNKGNNGDCSLLLILGLLSLYWKWKAYY